MVGDGVAIPVESSGIRVVLVERPGRVGSPTVRLELDGPTVTVKVELGVAAFKALLSTAVNVGEMLAGRGL